MIDLYLKEFEKLNDYQKKAVKSKDRYVLLNAAVGSGKTTVLTHRILYLHLFEKIPFEDMVVLTFTNRAAGEIRKRVSDFCGGIEADMKYFGTFHSVARTILSESPFVQDLGFTGDFTIMDNEESVNLFEEIFLDNKLNIKYSSKLSKRIEELRKGKSLYGVMKKEDDIKELYRLYCEEKIKRNSMDFNDLIRNCSQLLVDPLNPSYIIVDEFQDTDHTQLELIKKIAGSRTNIFVVGDPNQIIYSWRTGETNIFNEFRSAFKPFEMSLPLNYRSTRTIIEAAGQFINGSRVEGTKDYGNPIIIKKHHDAFNEALHISRTIKSIIESEVTFRDIAVLYRRQAQGEILFETLSREGIPCRIVYKKALIYEENSENAPESDDMVNLMTLHASKGLEFSHVFITGTNMGNIPLSSRRSEEEEEARLFFVGMTRAKNYLEISYLAKTSLPGAMPYPSTYIAMLPPGLIVKEDEESAKSLDELMKMLREEKELKKEEEKTKTALHPKYGTGKIIFEDDNIIRVEFQGYGEKEFSKMFCPLIL